MVEIVLPGVLVEYGSGVLPLPLNIVAFQFNPESITRTLHLPATGAGSDPERNARRREHAQISAPPLESFEITAHFSAADDLGKGGAASAIPRLFGVGPQIAALEKMAYPSEGLISGLIGEAIDAIGDALGGNDDGATRSVPRKPAPRILFIWGPSRLVPVHIKSMSIIENKYDALLNPVQAEVRIGLEIPNAPPRGDSVAEGALTYTATVKDAQAILNLAKAVEIAIDVIPF
ncbi:hypothetical protein SAMN05421688_0859 [Poseidonocella pacifica]|uniref:Uncharacterized protein n=1 Tax=Poseidonocella pacifica TaxID=871651 RepID=A0A1I0VPQ3_9RHOB|nr:hypothetical protein [Poseidonocella pacifica]SFA78429.1 hypothetical protein SAMN05421688_0859 [Poseidonocella pacifica]